MLALAARDAQWSVVRTGARSDAKGADAREVHRGTAPGGIPFERIVMSPCAKRLVGATATSLAIIDVVREGTIETISHGHGPISGLAYANDGLRILSAGEDGFLRLWRVEDDDTKAGAL